MSPILKFKLHSVKLLILNPVSGTPCMDVQFVHRSEVLHVGVWASYHMYNRSFESVYSIRGDPEPLSEDLGSNSHLFW